MTDAAKSKSSSFKIEESTLTLSDLPSNAVVVHAANCLGNWGAGFALAVATRFPNANKIYKDLCDASRPTPDQWPRREDLVGTCQMIAPQQGDFNENGGKPRVWIVNLFTSYGYGRGGSRGRGRGRVRGRGRGRGSSQSSTARPGKDSTAVIIQQTRMSVKEFRKQIDGLTEFGELGVGKEEDVVIVSPRFNSGSFKVPWERTQKIIEEEFEGFKGKWLILSSS